MAYWGCLMVELVFLFAPKYYKMQIKTNHAGFLRVSFTR